MTLSVSIAELGTIVYALQSVYSSNSEESHFADFLIDSVYDSVSRDIFNDWVSEFDISI